MKKILVVDDESLIRYSLMMMLQSEAIEVRSASTGAEALIEVHSHFYDLCFLDIHLPDISGLDVLKEIRDISPDTIVIIISANEPEEGLMEQRKDREYYIPKPFDLFQVKAFVDKVLSEGAHRYREENHAIKDYYNTFKTRLANDNRLHERKPIEKRITCLGASVHAEEKVMVFDANVIDISDGGVGIALDHELRPGQMLRFFDRAVACIGVVRWISRVDESPWYRSGIQFTEPHHLHREGST